MKKGIFISCILHLILLTSIVQGQPKISASGALKVWSDGVGKSASSQSSIKTSFSTMPNGVFTGLTGFCDFQVNGGSPKFISINPDNASRIHVTYMTAGDPDNIEGSRRVGYAYSSNGGVTWQSNGSISGTGAVEKFPALTLLPNGSSNTVAAIACSATPEVPERSVVFIDQIEGLGLFSFVSADTTGYKNNQLALPSLLANKDGSKMWMLATHPTNYASYSALWDKTTNKFSPFAGPLKTESGRTLRSFGIYGMAISGSGSKVAVYYIDVAGYYENTPYYLNLNYAESTDGGLTFPKFKTITPYPTVVDGDTLSVFAGCDAVYVGEQLHIVFSSCKPYIDQSLGRWAQDVSGQGLWHWSQSTGFTRAVDTTRMQVLFGQDLDGYRIPDGGLPQTNTFPIDYPSIGTGPDGSLFCVFQAARREKSKANFNYYTVLYTRSTDGGLTWSQPVEIETDAATDFRYPSVAKYNPPGEVNVVYQKDSEPGSGAVDGDAPVTEASLLFAKLNHDGVLSTDDNPQPKPSAYRLEQNYPNPFNPSTVIQFSLPKAGRVEITVYDLLGRQVSVLLNERKPAGSHQVTFNANGIASGIYFYRMRAGSFAETKKMVFLR